MTMHFKLHSNPLALPWCARLGAVAVAARALLAGVLRRPRPLFAGGGRNDGPPDLDGPSPRRFQDQG